jgi:tryptophan synthase alpha chain
MNRIDVCFAGLRSEGRCALMPFFTCGDPDLETSRLCVQEAIRRGASLIELGVPFSDPIADGPVIAASYTRALTRGFRLAHLWDTVRELRLNEGAAHPSSGATPLVTMVSYSIVNRAGVENYLGAARESGVDGLIIPDLPVEEAVRVKRLVDAIGLRLIQLVTPTTARDRAIRIAESSSGFLYVVSVAGITGERRSVPPELAENVTWLRSRTALPLCIGFGISSAEQVRQLAPLADGLIVGSALVRRIADLSAEGQSPAEIAASIGQFLSALIEPLLPAASNPG